MGDYSDEDSFIEVQLPDTTHDSPSSGLVGDGSRNGVVMASGGVRGSPAAGNHHHPAPLGGIPPTPGYLPGNTDSRNLPWNMTEAEMIKLLRQEAMLADNESEEDSEEDEDDFEDSSGTDDKKT